MSLRRLRALVVATLAVASLPACASTSSTTLIGEIIQTGGRAQPRVGFAFSSLEGTRRWVPNWKLADDGTLYDAAEYCRQCDDPELPTYSYRHGPAGPLPPRSTRDRTPEPPERRPFDPMAALVAVRGVALSACRGENAPRGGGHAVVRFTGDGHAVKVVIDDPAGLDDRAVQCIGLTLGRARVAPFAGPETDVGATFFVP
jgi:hypothetical protein